MSRCLYFIARNVSFPNSLSNSSPRQMIRSSFNPSYLEICIAILAKWISFIYPFASYVFRRCSAAGRTLAIYHRDNSYHRVFLANQAEIQRVKIFGSANLGGTRYRFAIVISSPPFSFAISEITQRAQLIPQCVCVWGGIRHYLLSFSLPPVFFSLPLSFSPHSSSRCNSNEWKVFKRAGSGISSLCCAILHLSIMAMRCRFHHSVGWKKAAQTVYRPATFYLHSIRRRVQLHFRISGVSVPIRFNANACCQKAGGAYPAPPLISIENRQPSPIITLANLNIPLHFPSRPITHRLTEGERSRLGSSVHSKIPPILRWITKRDAIFNNHNRIFFLFSVFFYFYFFFFHRSSSSSMEEKATISYSLISSISEAKE